MASYRSLTSLKRGASSFRLGTSSTSTNCSSAGLISAARSLNTCSTSNFSSSSSATAFRYSFNTGNRNYATAAASAKKSESVAPPPVSLSDTDKQRLSGLRNIGISAHIDSGKTTLTERVLFYTGRIKAIHEVRGKDAVGAKMDHMELEREKGITIQSAATYCNWKVKETPDGKQGQDYNFNIIDTPGHVDFTIEVERALRVLDGGVLVLCAVAGVQSQTITVDRQMKRYNVPRISFINKMDRPGANPWRVIDQIRNKLRFPAAALQVPIGEEDGFEGVVDLVRWRTIRFEGVKGQKVVESDEIPQNILEFAKEKRQELIETLADLDDEMANAYLEEREISPGEIADAIRRLTLQRKFTPVYMGSALGDTAVQPLLDGVCSYLPSPSESPAVAVDVSQPSEPELELVPAGKAPLVGLAFKLEEGKYGQLTYMRVYQGTLKKGSVLTNVRTGKKVRIPRLVRMHSEEMEDVESIGAGEICAMFGVDCSSGDSFTDGRVPYSMTSMFVPDPVVSLAIRPKGPETPAFGKALNRFGKEDPTFRMHIDKESNETIISGMGELHLEIYVERMRREYNVDCVTGKPQVAFREQITQKVPFNYSHKKQSGGAGQFGKVMGYLEPITEENENSAESSLGRNDLQFVSNIVGGAIPPNYIASVEKGFHDACERGSLSGYPIIRCRYVLEDGATHPVDSSELAFRLAGQGSVREAYERGKPVVLEPIMRVEVVAPAEFQGVVTSGLNSRRGTIVDTEVRDEEFTMIAEVPLNEMFGYSATLRGTTQGKGEFSMEYTKHAPTSTSVQAELVQQYKVLTGRK